MTLLIGYMYADLIKLKYMSNISLVSTVMPDIFHL